MEELKAEIRKTRAAVQDLADSVNGLARKYRFHRRVVIALCVLFAGLLGVGLWGYGANVDARNDLRDEACRADQESVRNARLANEALVSSLILVAIDPNDPEDRARAETFMAHLKDQQERLLSIPACR